MAASTSAGRPAGGPAGGDQPGQGGEQKELHKTGRGHDVSVMPCCLSDETSAMPIPVPMMIR